jgi:hypothetical protein
MTTRLAGEKDIELLEGMLARMGQLWSEKAIREALADPWITVIHETDGKPDGFYMVLALYETTGVATLGPGDAPHESHQAWLRAICEMGIALDEEEVRRHPDIDPTKCWIVTRIWPTMGPLREFLEAQFGWAPRTNAGRVSGKEGYTQDATGGRTYWIKRPNLVTRAKLVLARLEQRA